MSGGEANELSNSEQAPTLAEEGQSAEQDTSEGNDKETSAEQPTDTEEGKEGKEGEEEGGTDAAPVTKEGEGDMKEQANEATEDSGKLCATEEQSYSIEAITAEDGEKTTEQMTKEAHSEEKIVGDGELVEGESEHAERDGGEVSGETNGEKMKEPSLDGQKKDGEVEGEAEAAKSDDAAVIGGESSIKDTEEKLSETEQKPVQQREEGGTTENGAKIEEEEPVHTGEESGVMGMGVLNEPLADILEEDEEQEPVDREELLAATKEVLLEQERLKTLSAQLQHKIAEYLAKKKVCACTLLVKFMSDSTS